MDNNVPKVVIDGKRYLLPYQDRLPPHSPEEYEALKADIRQSKCIDTPIIVRVNSRNKTEVVDGATRLRIVAELAEEGVRVRWHMSFQEDGLKPQEAEAKAYKLNVLRRHLTPEQRREYIAKVLKDKPQRSNRQVAAQTGTDHKTVGAVRVKLEATGEIPQLKGTEGRDGKVRPARQKAKPAARKNGTPRREPATSTPTAERADASALTVTRMTLNGPQEVRLSSAPGSPSGVTYPDEGWPEGAAPDPAKLSSQDLDSLAVQLLRAAGRAEVMSRSLNARFKKDGIPKEEKQALRAEARHLGCVMDNIRQDWDLLIEWTADKIQNGQ
jgi:hypothetical protein